MQRLADASGTICVAKQRIGCGRAFARQTLTVHVSERVEKIKAVAAEGAEPARPRRARALKSATTPSKKQAKAKEE